MSRGCGVLIVVLIVGFLVLVIGGAGFQWVNSQPWFCNSCHEMNFHYQSWQASTHGTKATCLECHAEPGVRGFIEEKVRGAEQVVAHFTGNYKMPIQIIVRVRNDQCLACHPETPTLQDKAIEVNHAAHMDKQVLCADCHNRIVHAQPGQAHVMPRDQCEACHKAHTNFQMVGIHATLNCSQCHQDSKYQGTSSKCESCHQPPTNHAVKVTSGCDQCHAATGWKPAKFDHAKFSLIGKHQSVKCDQCHVGGKFQGTSPKCESCHQVSVNHIVKVTTGCEQCHTPDGWKPAKFDHTKFPLTGKHQSVTCDNCHANGKFAGTSPKCESCHQAPTNHPIKVTTGCEQCHTPEGWKPAKFDHTKFPLTGKHQNVTCNQCHKNNVFAGTASACASCHQPPATHAGMNSNCATCHSPAGFAPANFAHPNVGEHMGARAERPLPCARCHPSTFKQTTCMGSGCHSSNNPRGEGD